MAEKIDWHNAQFTAADLKKHFGLEAGGGTFGSSNAQLGKNYLSASDVDRLKSDPMIKEAYFALRGEDHARREHWDQDGNEGFELGEGSLDALLDDITADKASVDTDPAEDVAIEHSSHVLKAKERVKNWQDRIDSGEAIADFYDTPLRNGTNVNDSQGFRSDEQTAAMAERSKNEHSDAIARANKRIQQSNKI